jgi:hypothetical protein
MRVIADGLAHRIEAGLKPVEGKNRNDLATDAGQSKDAEHCLAALSPQFLQFHIASPAWRSGIGSFGKTRTKRENLESIGGIALLLVRLRAICKHLLDL